MSFLLIKFGLFVVKNRVFMSIRKENSIGILFENHVPNNILKN